ncbi:sensory box histidine kinase [Methylophaga frappieri]|uniref:histidine kinase n=1 Tax=Methylophaga frappieri (strain ATCC BAA-2434 / DSM 25690 / JAM7) TaxID=754477 RepID=I1YEU3_METFJ|nr:sensor histidine kinase [Methylophaga frappieri]AFJ01436.1 sensory box histidine kinase [Methylophaga frappieri]
MSLRGLINVRIIITVLLIIIVGGLLTVWQARKAVEREVDSSFNLALQMIDLGFSHLSRSSLSEFDWLRQVSTIQKIRHINISIVNDMGEEVEWFQEDVLRDSQKIPPDWFVNLVINDYPQAEYNIQLADGRNKKMIIRADPIDEIEEAWGESQSYFWSVVAMMGVIFLAINVVFNSMLRTVHSIVIGLRRVESGQYGKKLPNFQISEFDVIASEINNLTDALQAARDSNQALARHTMHIQENERRNLSRELHDEMGQSLTAIKAMAVTNRKETANHVQISDSMIEICTHLSGVVRSMMRTLHPLSLTDLGLGATLSDMVNESRRRYPALKINLQYDHRLDAIPHELAIHVYRIVQESLTNVVRHANATHIWIQVIKEGETSTPRVVMRIKDDGQGKSIDEKQPGFGILAMRERVENMGGRFRFESVPNQGASVQAWMPIDEKQQDER